MIGYTRPLWTLWVKKKKEPTFREIQHWPAQRKRFRFDPWVGKSQLRDWTRTITWEMIQPNLPLKSLIKYCAVVRWAQSLGCVWLFATPWTVVRQTPLSMGFFSRQEYWSGLPFPPPGDLGPKDWTVSLVSPALAGRVFTTELTGEALIKY